MFCAADHGTVTGLRELPRWPIEAEVDPGWAGPVAAWGLPTVRAAVEAFAEALAPAPVSAAEIGALRPAIGALLRDFWLDPSPDEARAWGAFPFNLGEGHGSFVAALAEPYGLRDLRRALGGGKLLKKHEHFWVEGALAASPAALRRLLATARRLRRLRGARTGGAGRRLRLIMISERRAGLLARPGDALRPRPVRAGRTRCR